MALVIARAVLRAAPVDDPAAPVDDLRDAAGLVAAGEVDGATARAAAFAPSR